MTPRERLWSGGPTPEDAPAPPELRPLPRLPTDPVEVGEGGATSTGTGFLIDRNGTVVTNAHVVGSAGSAQVRFGDQGRTLDAPVLGRDPSSDLAVLRVDPSLTGRLYPLALADSSKVHIGD